MGLGWGRSVVFRGSKGKKKSSKNEHYGRSDTGKHCGPWTSWGFFGHKNSTGSVPYVYKGQNIFAEMKDLFSVEIHIILK